MQPETIDQQAAGTGAGLGPAFMYLQSGLSPRHQKNTGVLTSWKPSSLFGQVRTQTAFYPSKVQWGGRGGGGCWE